LLFDQPNIHRQNLIMNNERISYLLKQYLADSITGTEWQELKELLMQDKSAMGWQEALDSLIDNSPALPDYEEAAWEPLYRKILEGNAAAGTGRFSGGGRLIRLLKKRIWVAAAILILFMAGSWLLFFRQGGGKEMARTVSPRLKPANDVAPGSTKAVLTLADGSMIDLNAAGNGLVGRQGNSKLVKLKGGQLAYQTATSHELQANSEPTYNTIATPKGGEYQLILPDGSKVWLNAASSLRYPTSFSGKERVVELKGEAYFEVTHLATKDGDEKMPFRVHIVSPSGDSPFRGQGAGVDVLVLGTHFNVMAYADEQSINTTLLEGSVRLRKGDKEALIRPGEQARLKEGSGFKVVPVDTDEAVAWKNGLFRFNEATIEEVMRQLSRWYDMEVVYVNGAPKDLFRGEIYRNVNVSKVLKVLEASGVHFTVEGKKILVQS
jgi:ferric-dicitrate binding protein FerR (iron transport regulator)